MSELMISYVKEQVPMTRTMTEARADIAAPFMEAFGGMKPARVFLLGSGSSYHASLMAKPVVQKVLGVEVSVSPPTLMPCLKTIDVKNSMFIAVSQGGRSSSTMDKVEEIRAAGGKVVAITGSHDTPVAKGSDVSILLRCGEETLGPKTKGVTGSILTLIFIAMEWGKKLGTADAAFCDALIADIGKAADNMDENIARTLAWCERNKVEMAPCTHIAVLGEKFDFGVALESAMKLLETIDRPVIGYEFEEYLHGVFCMLTEQSYMMFLLPYIKEDQGRFIALYEYAKKYKAKCYMISRGDYDDDSHNLNLVTTGNDYLSFFEILLPGQLLSAVLSAQVGLDVGTSTHPDFNDAVPFHVGEKRPWA